MKPRERRETGEQDLFRARLDQIIDMRHELVKLAQTIDWRFLESRFGEVYSDGPGMPPLPTRLMAGLAILKHTFNLSDEELCARWVENPYFQYLCGEEFFCHKLPFERSSMTRWRQRMGDDKVVALLQESLAVAVKTGARPGRGAYPTGGMINHDPPWQRRQTVSRLGTTSGHTLATVIPDMEATIGAEIERVLADAGYRGHNAPLSHKFRVFTSGQKRRMTPTIKREMKRRAAIEPVIGHIKNEHRMDRNYLLHAAGDAINPVLAAAGYNFSLLLKWLRVLLCLMLTTLFGQLKPRAA